jgi:hypothetical protein
MKQNFPNVAHRYESKQADKFLIQVPFYIRVFEDYHAQEFSPVSFLLLLAF